MKYIKTTEKVAVENYPYGYTLKTTAFYSIESNNKGFRTVFQTINPKNGKLNAPKKSTYSPVRVLKEVDGKIGSHTLDFYGDEGLVKDIKFLEENFDLFTRDEIKSIAVHIIALSKASIYAKVVYTNSNQDKLLPLFDSLIKTLVKIANTGDNLFGEIVYDIPAIKALEVAGYNPFTVR